jgi:hypothetical protein
LRSAALRDYTLIQLACLNQPRLPLACVLAFSKSRNEGYTASTDSLILPIRAQMRAQRSFVACRDRTARIAPFRHDVRNCVWDRTWLVALGTFFPPNHRLLLRKCVGYVIERGMPRYESIRVDVFLHRMK